MERLGVNPAAALVASFFLGAGLGYFLGRDAAVEYIGGLLGEDPEDFSEWIEAQREVAPDQ